MFMHFGKIVDELFCIFGDMTNPWFLNLTGCEHTDAMAHTGCHGIKNLCIFPKPEPRKPCNVNPTESWPEYRIQGPLLLTRVELCYSNTYIETYACHVIWHWLAQGMD